MLKRKLPDLRLSSGTKTDPQKPEKDMHARTLGADKPVQCRKTCDAFEMRQDLYLAKGTAACPAANPDCTARCITGPETKKGRLDGGPWSI
ncbi:hypothetical protein AB9K35_19490 [Leisingera sp. XS_AS12]|uniref:hypothetical protein n=1 Tax=unclassified Leisingera TaxID=2614906 RepID=UPI003511D0BA